MEGRKQSNASGNKNPPNKLTALEKLEQSLPTKERDSRAGSMQRRIQSQQQSKRSSQHRNLKDLENNNLQHIEEIKSKFSQFGLSDVSKYSRESNGFKNTMTKPGRVYNDGRVTFYSGRLFTSQPQEFRKTGTTVLNRKMKYHDTFLSVFPGYRITRDPKHSVMRKHYKYPSRSIEGGPTHVIDRTHN